MAATVAMSAALALAARAGLLQEPPPRAIVRRLLPGLSREAVDAGALLAHLGYGTAGGVVHRGLLGGPGPAASALYGVALWAGGYEGWVPRAGALRPAPLDDRRRRAPMAVAHVVYGAVLGALAPRRRRALRRDSGRLLRAAAAEIAPGTEDGHPPQPEAGLAVESSE